MRTRIIGLGASLPSTVTILLLFLAASTSADDVKNDFSYYPKGSQQCLNQASDSSKCSGSTTQEMNSCLCSNGGNFVLGSASCIGEKDKANLGSVYDTMAQSCKDSETDITIAKSEWLNAGSTTSSPTTSQSPTTMTSVSDGHTVTITSSPTPTAGSDNNGGMSSTAKTGIIAGASVAGALILLAMVFFFLRYRAKKSRDSRDESHPMLPTKFGHSDDMSNRYSAAPPSSVQHDWKHDSTQSSEAKWRPSPDPEHGHWSAAAVSAQGTMDRGSYQSGLSSPGQQAWGYNPNAPYQPPPPQPAVFEMPAEERSRPAELAPSTFAEMPGSPPIQQPANAQHPAQHSSLQPQPPAQGWMAYNPGR